MNRDHLYAFYGSLRKGMTNHRVYRHGLEYLYTEVLPGFSLHSLRWFPYAVRAGEDNSSIVVEVFRVTDASVEMAIHELETGYGYVYEEVEIRGRVVGIYLFEKAGSEPSVESGDWVKFFGSR